jgi:hypothetical protein
MRMHFTVAVQELPPLNTDMCIQPSPVEPHHSVCTEGHVICLSLQPSRVAAASLAQVPKLQQSVMTN